MGTLGKCYYLCEHPKKGSPNSNLHINCLTCLYKNSQYKKIFEGNCPNTPEIIDPVSPVNGECPINKPILKDGKCQLIYCTNEEYLNNIW